MKGWMMLAGASLLAMAGSAHAQSASRQGAQDDTGASASEDATAPADIIVTAQRRAESLKEVPIAITVVNGEAIRETGANQLSDIAQRAPSLTFQPTPANPNFTVRGIGSNSFDVGIESAVGVAIDDVNVTLPRFVPLNSLADVERVEVLRGPQGLLFGKNTTAGLLSVTSARPRLGEWSSSGRIQAGSRDQIQSQVVVNAPIGDTVALRVVGGYQHQRPVIKVVGPGRLQETRNWFVDGKLLWKPTDRLSLYAIGGYQSNSGADTWTIRKFGTGDSGLIPAAFRPYAPPTFVRTQLTALGIVPSPTNDRSGIGSTDIYNDQHSARGQLTVDYDLGPATITSITAYRNLRQQQNGEVDQTPIPFLDTNSAHIRAYQLSQELRIANNDPGFLTYVAGVYFYRQKVDATILQTGTLGVLPAASPLRLSATTGSIATDYRSKSYAPFAQLTFNLTRALRLIGGLRYTHDDVDLTATTSAAPNVCDLNTYLGSRGRLCLPTLPAPRTGSRSADGFSAKGGIAYDIGRTANLYATYTRGYKGPAISSAGNATFAVDPETVDAYEVGAKLAFLNNRATLNVAGFINDFHDFQAQVFDPALNGGIGAFRTGNAQSLKSRGVEAEATLRPFRGFALFGGVTYLDAKYGNYRVACYAGQTAAQGCSLAGPSFNAAGFPLTNAAKWTTSLGGNYSQPVGAGVKVFVNADWRYRTSTYFQVGNPNTIQPAYSIVNATAGIGDIGDHAKVSVFVRNLFDKRYAGTIFPGYFDVGQYAQVLPDNAFRRIGAALEWRF